MPITRLPRPTLGDRAFFERSKIDPSIRPRITVERAVFRKTITLLIDAGYELRVHEGGDWACERTTNHKVLMEAIMSTDEDRLYVYRPDDVVPFGWVFFVYGNSGWDVLNDHTTNLSEVLEPVDAYVDELSGVMS